MIRLAEGNDMTLPRATALGWTKSSIYEFAGLVSRTLKYEPGGRLTPIVGRLGGHLIYQNIFEAQHTNDGSIKIEPGGLFEIYLPDYVSVERNRFTIAHEVGHYFLHYLLGGKQKEGLVAARSSERQGDRAEWEANWFSAGFLMPDIEFRTKSKELNGDVVGLARHFRVSVESCRIHKRFHENTP